MRTNIEVQTYLKPESIENCEDYRIQEIFQHINEKIADPLYPCVGAKAAFNSNQYRLGIYGAMGASKTTQQLGEDLKRYILEAKPVDSDYLSFIAVFTDEIDSEMDFENKLWLQLQSLYDIEKHEHSWAPGVSHNPEDNDFSFSFFETAFFIVGLHPRSSRTARRFKYPALAFNLHRQFEKLRENDQYENMKEVIRKRDFAYDGSTNPMLKDFGKGSEAPQYSGREVEKNWKCPFHAGLIPQIQNKDDSNH